MKVSELIRKLNEVPHDYIIDLWDYYDEYSNPKIYDIIQDDDDKEVILHITNNACPVCYEKLDSEHIPEIYSLREYQNNNNTCNKCTVTEDEC